MDGNTPCIVLHDGGEGYTHRACPHYRRRRGIHTPCMSTLQAEERDTHNVHVHITGGREGYTQRACPHYRRRRGIHTPCMSTLQAEERDTHTVHVHITGGGEGYTHRACPHYRRRRGIHTQCMSTLQAEERDTPCTPILQAVHTADDTPLCTHSWLRRWIQPARLHCWRWTIHGYTLHVPSHGRRWTWIQPARPQFLCSRWIHHACPVHTTDGVQ